jgi:hypothetical protein
MIARTVVGKVCTPLITNPEGCVVATAKVASIDSPMARTVVAMFMVVTGLTVVTFVSAFFSTAIIRFALGGVVARLVNVKVFTPPLSNPEYFPVLATLKAAFIDSPMARISVAMIMGDTGLTVANFVLAFFSSAILRITLHVLIARVAGGKAPTPNITGRKAFSSHFGDATARAPFIDGPSTFVGLAAAMTGSPTVMTVIYLRKALFIRLMAP